MNDLQRELRAAFERQQAGLGDTAGVRQRMIRKAVTAKEPRRSQIFRTAVGLAAVLVAAAAVGTTVYIRELSQPKPGATPTVSASAQPSPTATPVPTALANPLQVPASMPVVLYHDPVNFDQIDGTTWDGSQSGRVGTTGHPGWGILPNPAGTLYATYVDIRDRSGQVVASLGTNNKAFGTWADDERHYCQMVSASPFGKQTGEPASLQLVVPGQPAHTVVQVGTAYEQGVLRLPACSVQGDRAMVVQAGGQGEGTAQFWLVQLSTGRILWFRSYSVDWAEVEIRASRDGQYTAEVRRSMGQPTTTTTIYGTAGSVLGHVAGSVEAFSWDGRLAVVTSTDGSVSLIRWQDGKALWTGPRGTTFYSSLAEPDGSRLAVGLRNPAYQQTTGFPPIDVYVVGPDGQATQLLQRVAF
jgi:hypothetical protein